MRLVLQKIRKHLLKYISVIFALVIIQLILFIAPNLLLKLEEEMMPPTVFSTDNIYTISNRLLNEAEGSEAKCLSLNATQAEQIAKIDGLEALGSSSGYNKEIVNYWRLNSKLDSTVKVFYSFAGYDFQKLYPVELLKGSFFQSENNAGMREVIITETVAKKIGVWNEKLPATRKFPKQYEHEKGEELFRICGIVKDVEHCNSKVRSELVHPLYIRNQPADFREFRIEPNADLYEIRKQIDGIIRKSYGNAGLSVEIYKAADSNNLELIRDGSKVLPAITAVPLIVLYTIIALWGLFYGDMKRKRIDYGVMRAVGFSQKRLFYVIISEAILLTGISSVVILLLVLNLPGLINEMWKEFQGFFTVSESCFISIFLMMGLLILASLMPAIKTLKIQPVEALAEE